MPSPDMIHEDWNCSLIATLPALFPSQFEFPLLQLQLTELITSAHHPRFVAWCETGAMQSIPKEICCCIELCSVYRMQLSKVLLNCLNLQAAIFLPHLFCPLAVPFFICSLPSNADFLLERCPLSA